MSEKKVDLCIYRMRSAIETLGASALCLESQHYKDSINRSYYAAFYAVKAVLALEEVDFKRHKDAVAYFNKTYVATGIRLIRDWKFEFRSLFIYSNLQ